ncbi:MAG: hypothetical protein ACYTGQ_06760, partial [Planctomycetota bacterium]
DPESWAVEQWNYLWTQNYGSPEFSVANPDQQGHDEVAIEAVTLSSDRKSAFLHIDHVQPVMQMSVRYNLDADDGELIKGAIYNTIHKPAPAYKQ